jgi:hypothetical protein
MLLSALLEGRRKSGAIWYMILRQSPKARCPAEFFGIFEYGSGADPGFTTCGRVTVR